MNSPTPSGFLSIEQVVVGYGQDGLFPALGFSAQAGELIGILGPSGVGKSSLLRVMAGLQTPLAGAVRVDGRRVDEVPPADRGIAMLFQDPVIYDHMSAFENIAFPMRCAHDRAESIDQEVHRIASIVGLQDLLGVSPARLSGGERQRLALARAFATRSKCALLDEPVKAAFEPAMRSAIRRHIRELHLGRGGVTVIVSHEQQEITEICDRLLFIFRDRTYVMTPAEAVARPPDERIARFMAIGSVVQGTVAADGSALDLGDGILMKFPSTGAVPRKDGDSRLWFVPPAAVSLRPGTSLFLQAMSWTAAGPTVTLQQPMPGNTRSLELKVLPTRLEPGTMVEAVLEPGLLHPLA